MERYVGLDVHCKQCVYVCQDEQGKVVARGRIETNRAELTKLAETLRQGQALSVALETGSQAAWVSRALEESATRVWVVDAREVRAKARRVGQKSDGRDAFELCDGLRRGIFTTRVWVPPVGLEQLRALLSRRRHFVRVATQQINAAKYVLRARALGAPASLKTPRAWRSLIERCDDEQVRDHLDLHAQLWQLARSHVARLETKLLEAIEPYRAVMDLLMTVPGVGVITAATYLAMIGCPGRFETSGQVASYLGLVPSTFDSGERQCHGHLTRRGCTHLRAVLCEAAHHARRPTHPLHPYFARTVAAKGYKRAVVAVAQRLARILWRVWRDRKPFDVDCLNIVAARREVKKTIFYQIRKERLEASA